MGRDKVASVFILLTVSILSTAVKSLEKSTNNNTDEVFLSKVASVLAEFCPRQDLARMDSNTGSTDTGSCCTEFFYSNDTNSITNQGRVYAVRPFQKCVFVQTGEAKLFTPTMSYYVVVDAPPGGCLARVDDHESVTEEEETFLEPHCDDDVSPWRRLIPVFSKSSSLIYKTPNCALCHGVRDIIYWSPTVICEGQIPSFTSDMTKCDIVFDYPGNRDDVKHLHCFKRALGTCHLGNDDKLSKNIGLTQNELRQACHMDNLPPFNHMIYSKNLFCYVCNNANFFPVKSCQMYSFDDNKKSLGRDAFIGLINTESLRRLDDAAPTVGDSAACIIVNNETECHQVMCPIGQIWVRRGKQRECAFELAKWERARLKAILVLTSDASITIDATDLKTIITERQLTSPWPRGWKISSLNRKVAELPETITCHDNVDVVNASVNPEATATNQLFVEVVFINNSFNPKDVLQEVATAMKKTWTLSLNEERILFKQRMSRYKLSQIWNSDVLDSRRIFDAPMWYRMRYNAPVPIGSMPIFEVVTTDDYDKYFSYYINDLFLCPQVELPDSFFTVFRFDSFLFNALYTATTGYLFDNEFHHLVRSSGHSYFRVCVDNVIKETSASASRSSCSLTFMFSFMRLTFTVLAAF